MAENMASVVPTKFTKFAEVLHADDDDGDICPQSSTETEMEKQPLVPPQAESIQEPTESQQDVERWNVFMEMVQEAEDETESSSIVQNIIKTFKAIVILICFFIVLATSVVSKSSLLLMTSVIWKNASFRICKKYTGLEMDKTYQVRLSDEERYGWIWCLIFALIIPEVLTLFQSCRLCIFKSFKKPSALSFLLVLFMETVHTVGVLMLVFMILPKMDAVRGFMLTNAVCLLPAILNIASRDGQNRDKSLKIAVDVICICFQATSFIVWPVLEHLEPRNQYTYYEPGSSHNTVEIKLLAPALIFISFRWWENFMPNNILEAVRSEVNSGRPLIYIFVSIWKMLLTLSLALLFLFISNKEDISKLFTNFKHAFEAQVVSVHWVRQQYNIPGHLLPDPEEIHLKLLSEPMVPVIVAAVQVLSSLLCYQVSKFACKIGIQAFSYALPLCLTVPTALSLLLTACSLRNEDPCSYRSVSNYLFWQCPSKDFEHYFSLEKSIWIWILWIISQAWIAAHVWRPKAERMASTQKLFVNPLYCSPLIDQSLLLNRRKNEQAVNGKDSTENLPFLTFFDDMYVPKTVPMIYACATMWHETAEEMEQLLKSIIRMDEDQAARRNAQRYLRAEDPDYYMLEAHIFFDDVFVPSDEKEGEVVVNSFVKDFVNVIDQAASKVHETLVTLPPPVKIPTPYGGRLVWTLPGHNKLYVHLKNKELIRHKKRWSQVMYMYYLLGHRLMDSDESLEDKETQAENTFILALDGDINFNPHAVQLLVDLMKKNKVLGAACGRIHPVGTGPMVYYQKFEYAIGHWLQKATEHMIGCVLCSPGCFSLFRAKALMDDNVMRTYTTKSREATQYVQYDQGEDRWLCTLLLKRGYRVEYSAASDGYTHCPETFAEFYTQRRRWAPSTMANIMDLLIDYKQTVACNDNISLPYISYQVLMMAGTILGPGTIFLMLVGAMVSAFGIDGTSALLINLVPITLFIIVCFTTKNDVQILLAQILSALYALLMMAVLVGIALQVKEDGISSPSAIFLVSLASSFIIAAILHPQEFWCVVHGVLYFLSVPSMYLFLFLYSIINLNVVSWGTREVQTTTKKQMEAEEQKKVEEAIKQQKKGSNVVNWINSLTGFRGSSEEEEGSISFGVANLFRCMCCTYPKSSEEKIHLIRIEDRMEIIGDKISVLQRQIDESSARNLGIRRSSLVKRPTLMSNSISTVAEKLQEDEEDEVDYELERDVIQEDEDNHTYNMVESNNHWLGDQDLKDGNVEYLDDKETNFWKDMIQKYLLPLDDNPEEKAKTAAQLKELRNKVVFAFLMLNSLFILVVFLLQMKKEQLYISWPLNVHANITYVADTNQVIIDAHPQRLEPINLVLAFFFTLILVIQFIAMLFHRLETLSHILASTDLNMCTKGIEDVNAEASVNKHAVPIARHMQKVKTHQKEKAKNEDRVERRQTVIALENRRQNRTPSTTIDLSAIFEERFENVDKDPALSKAIRRFSKNPNTLMELQKRRNTFVERCSQSGSQPGTPWSGTLERIRYLDRRFEGTPTGSIRTPNITPGGSLRVPVVRMGGGVTNAAFYAHPEDNSRLSPRTLRRPLSEPGRPTGSRQLNEQGVADEAHEDLQRKLSTISEKLN